MDCFTYDLFSICKLNGEEYQTIRITNIDTILPDNISSCFTIQNKKFSLVECLLNQLLILGHFLVSGLYIFLRDIDMGCHCEVILCDI